MVQYQCFYVFLLNFTKCSLAIILRLFICIRSYLNHYTDWVIWEISKQYLPIKNTTARFPSLLSPLAFRPANRTSIPWSPPLFLWLVCMNCQDSTRPSRSINLSLGRTLVRLHFWWMQLPLSCLSAQKTRVKSNWIRNFFWSCLPRILIQWLSQSILDGDALKG